MRGGLRLRLPTRASGRSYSGGGRSSWGKFARLTLGDALSIMTPIKIFATRAGCVKYDAGRPLQSLVIASLKAENRFPLFGTMLYPPVAALK
ncbi:MAG: hypothetical protein ABJA20_05320 [Novosphingobium sp.]